jgi:hypothetical protein
MRLVAPVALLTLLALPASAEDAKPSPPPLPAPRLVGPRTGPEKAKALVANGGTSASEKAVAAGLDWLARHQGSDGLWDADGFPSRCAAGGKACDGIGKGQHGEEIPCPFDEAISALATLAFLGAGHLPGDAASPHGAVVEKALARLESAGDVWSLPIATEVLSEAEAMERKGRWRDAAARGAQQLLAARQKDGAWGYCVSFRPGSDVPYTALVASALVAARDAGVELPADLGTRVDGFLNSLEESKGRLAYLVDGRNYGYTPTRTNAHAAIAIRQLLQVGLTGAKHKAHLSLVSGMKPEWQISAKEVETKDGDKVMRYTGNLSLYQWWYGTVAKFQEGGAAWSSWFDSAKSALVQHQETTGCARGSWDPLGQYERATGGRVFATALGVLMLEQPYRHRRLGPG